MSTTKLVLLALAIPLVMASIMSSNNGIQADGGSTGIGHGASTLQSSPPGVSLLNLVFDAGTDDDYVSAVYENVNGSGNIGLSGHSGTSHWDPSRTATNDGLSDAQGEPLTLTYSFIPDGTNMPAQFAGDTGCDSILIATLDDIYGAANWRNEVDQVFARGWEAKTGNQYLFEANDDGAAWPESPGISGLRGDIRIGGCAIDGQSGILAFSYYPSLGDMKIEVTEEYFSPDNLETGVHNVFSHEHGHGAGISHVCPIDQTKLMEPKISSAFIGLQHHDIRAAQRLYGDFNEIIGGGGNDTEAQPTNLGALADNVPVLVSEVSIDGQDDEDWHSFTVGTNKKIDVTVGPIGLTYLSGPQNNDGNCSAGTPTNSLAVHDLAFEVIDSDGTTVLASVNASAAGFDESLSGLTLGEAGTRYIRVIGDGTDDIQLYDLSFEVSSAAVPELVFTVQPTDTAAGTTITPPVKVAAQDGHGNTILDFTGEITVAIDANLPAGTLSGTNVVAAENGIATFIDLSINRGAAGYTLAATAPGLTGVSSAFAVAGSSGGPDAPETNITSSPPSVTNSADATFTFTSSKDDSTFQCGLDGRGFSPCTSPRSYSALPEGNHLFQVQSTNSAGNPDPTPASYAWTVKAAPPENLAPLAQDRSVITSQDVPLAVSLDFNDPDGPGPYSFTIVTPPGNGGLTNLGPNPTYTAAPGFTGTDSFRWQVNDHINESNPATVFVTIDPVNNPADSVINDDFDRPDNSTVGEAWVEVEDEHASVTIANGRLYFADTSDAVNRPMVRRSFSPVSSGILQWDFDFDWTRTEDEGTYRFLMQLGDGAAMTDDTQNGGAGVNLVWTQIDGVHQSLGNRDGDGDHALAVLSGPAHITVVADLEASSYSVAVDEAVVGTNIPFDADVALNTVRFFTDAVNEEYVLGRSIDNVIVSAWPPPVSAAIGSANTLLSEAFDHPDRSTVDGGWVEVELPGASVTISDERLFFDDTSDVINRPGVISSFTGASTGTLTWGFDFDWTRTGDESTYRVMMQLGDSTAITDDSQNDGVGVNLIWSKIGEDHEVLGYRDGGGDHALAVLSGPAHIDVVADLEASSYSVAVDNLVIQTGLSFDNPVHLNTVRFLTDSLNEANFSGRTFDNVIVTSPG